jgi:GxxExxY protein
MERQNGGSSWSNATLVCMEPTERVHFELTEQVIAAALEVHRTLGPGLLESAYQECLFYELLERGMRVERQIPIPLNYKRVKIANAYRMDLAVNELLLIEIKSVEAVSPLHRAQVLTYLKLTGFEVALIINFNSKYLRDGIKRLVQSDQFRSPRPPRSPRLIPPEGSSKAVALAPAAGSPLEETLEQIDSPKPGQ